MIGRLLSCLLAMLMPIALGLLALDSARAMNAPLAPAAMSAMQMDGCVDHQSRGAPPAPLCQQDCPLLCSPVVPSGSMLEAPIRPYVRLHFDLVQPRLGSRSLKPELPPPRREPVA